MMVMVISKNLNQKSGVFSGYGGGVVRTCRYYIYITYTYT